jgi:hypothetical protein
MNIQRSAEEVVLTLPADAEVARRLREMCIEAMWKPSGPAHYR